MNSKLGELSDHDKFVKNQNRDCVFLDDDSHVSKIPKVACVPSDLTIIHAVEPFQEILPKWGWKQTDYNFDWFPSFPKEMALTSYAKISSSNWSAALAFLHGLSWDSEPSLKTAYIELAFEAWFRGVRFSDIPSTPQSYSVFLRKCINQCFKNQHLGQIAPGCQKPGSKSLGKTLPAGYIVGWANVSQSALKSLALCLFQGKSQRLSEWCDPFV